MRPARQPARKGEPRLHVLLLRGDAVELADPHAERVLATLPPGFLADLARAAPAGRALEARTAALPLEEVRATAERLPDGRVLVALARRPASPPATPQRSLAHVPGWERLTPREREVALLLLGGARPSAVAARLGISVHTTRTHVKRVYRKLGLHGRTELLARALAQPGGQPPGPAPAPAPRPSRARRSSGTRRGSL